MKRFIFLAIFLSLITYGYAYSNVTNINNVRDYSGFGVNFDPLKWGNFLGQLSR